MELGHETQLIEHFINNTYIKVLSSDILLIGLVRVKTYSKANSPWLDKGAVTQASKSLFKASTSSLNLDRPTVLTKVQLLLIASSQGEGTFGCGAEALAAVFLVTSSWSSEDDSSFDCCCGCIIGGGIMNIIGCCGAACCLRARLRSRSPRPMVSRWQWQCQQLKWQSQQMLLLWTTYIQHNCHCQSNQAANKSTSHKYTHLAGCCRLDCLLRFFLGFGLRFFEIFSGLWSEIFWDFSGLWSEIFWDFFWAFCLVWYFWDFLRFFEIFWDFLRFFLPNPNTKKCILRFFEIFWDFLRFFEIFFGPRLQKCIPKKGLEIFWGFLRFLRFFEIFWDFLRFFIFEWGLLLF